VVKGIANFNNLTAFCIPTGSMTIEFTAQLDGLDASYSLSTFVSLSFRNCRDGEVLVDNQCAECPTGSYAISYSPSAKCQSCPEDAAGCSGSSIVLRTGYWMPSRYSKHPLTCPFGSKACVGGDLFADTEASQINATVTAAPAGSRRLTASGVVADPAQSTAGCAKGYHGPLCGACNVDYYFSQTQKECLPCSGQGQGQLALLIIVPLMLVAVAVFTVSNFICAPTTQNQIENESYAAKDKKLIAQMRSAIMPKVKILLTTLQIISGFSLALDVSYPVAANALFTAFR
jgi:hypothetical protein